MRQTFVFKDLLIAFLLYALLLNFRKMYMYIKKSEQDSKKHLYNDMWVI